MESTRFARRLALSNVQKFKENDRVMIKNEEISTIYTITNAQKDPKTELWQYQLKDEDEASYDGSKAQNGYVAQHHLMAGTLEASFARGAEMDAMMEFDRLYPIRNLTVDSYARHSQPSSDYTSPLSRTYILSEYGRSDLPSTIIDHTSPLSQTSNLSMYGHSDPPSTIIPTYANINIPEPPIIEINFNSGAPDDDDGRYVCEDGTEVPLGGTGPGGATESTNAPRDNDSDQSCTKSDTTGTGEENFLVDSFSTTSPDPHPPPTGFISAFSDHDSDKSCNESDEIEEGTKALSYKEYPNSTSNSSNEFSLSDIDEDLLHPTQYQKKLHGLQDIIDQGSSFLIKDIEAKGSIPMQGDEENLEIQKHNEKLQQDTQQRAGFGDIRLEQYRQICQCITRNIDALIGAQFGNKSITFLQLDPKRPAVALLRSISIVELSGLVAVIDPEGKSLQNFWKLARICHYLLGSLITSVDIEAVGDYVLLSLRVFHLMLVSHVHSHVGNFKFLSTGDPSAMFHISHDQATIIYAQRNDSRSITLSRRRLKCLDGFLGGHQAWVFHGPGTDSQSSDELYISAEPDIFADTWGPMWKITSVGEPGEILRYDLEHGSVIPLSLTTPYLLATNNPPTFLEGEADEDLSHWVSRSDLRVIQNNVSGGVIPLLSRRRLLIGACEHSVVRNPECVCDMGKAKTDFQCQSLIRDLHFVPSGWRFDSVQIGTSFGGAGIGVSSLSFNQTMRNIPGRTAKEAFYKRWINRKLRNWKCLLMYCGLEISICTRNSRRLRFVDLLAGPTVRELLHGLVGYADQPWKCQFEQILDTDPENLVSFAAKNATWRPQLEEYIGYCLESLIESGIRSRTDKGSTDNKLCAFWSYGREEMIVAFPPKYYSWTGFFDFESVCSFVVLEKCLVNRFGRICSHPKSGVRDRQADFPAVLEIFVVVNREDRPFGMKKLIRHEQKFWKVDCIDHEKHAFYLNERGKLHSYQCCSKTVVVGKWARKSPLSFHSKALMHSEHVYDGAESDIHPLPYLVQEERE